MVSPGRRHGVRKEIVVFQLFRRALVFLGCLLYAGACIMVATGEATRGDAKWVLWFIAIAHLIFGLNSFLQCFSDESQQTIDQQQKERAADHHRLAELEETVTILSAKVASLQAERDAGTDSKTTPSEMVD
jgi:hypothetical protein